MKSVLFYTARIVLISVFILIFSAGNYCLADLIPTDYVNDANVVDIRRKQVIFSDDLVLLMDKCNIKDLAQDKKEQCINELNSMLSESRNIHKLLNAQLEDTNKRKAIENGNLKKAIEAYNKRINSSAKIKKDPYTYRFPRSVDYSESIKNIQQSLNDNLEDQKRIIDNLKLLGGKENISKHNQNKKEKEVLTTSKLSLLGFVFFISLLGLIFIKRNVKFKKMV